MVPGVARLFPIWRRTSDATLAAGVRTTVGIDTHSNDSPENLKLAVLTGRARARLVGQGGHAPESLHHLLYANGLSVRHVITDGHVQWLDGRLQEDDEARAVREGAADVQQLHAQLRAEGWFR
jgi:hypothetical protein